MKILITSDIHIYDYPQYNKDGFRLKQFEKLAHRLNEIADQHNCEMLILAGDIIHKPVLRPYVVYAANQFMSILGARFGDKIRFILGQHDLDTKSTSHYNTDSIIPVISNYGIYMHNNSELIDGVLFGFSDWTPDQDWTKIKGIRKEGTPVDVMIGHLTLDAQFGQDYNSNFYKIGIFGDIHQPREFDNNKTWTCNVPIPHYISDSQYGSVIVLDTEDLSIKRIPTESEDFKYLKIFYDDSIPENCKDYPHLRIVERPKSIVAAESFHKSIDVNAVIEKIVQEKKLEDIHKEITVDKENIEPLDFNFHLNWIKIKNFRSIDEFYYEFKPGMTVMNGLNGSGKSSFLRAINYLFTGNESERVCVKSGKDNLLVEGEIVYQGRIHHIKRSWKGGNSLQYEIDGNPVNAVGIRAIKDEIARQLPFINYISLIIRAQRDPGLLTNFGFAKRIELISNLLGLNLISVYLKASISKRNEVRSEVNALQTQIDASTIVVNQYSNYDFSLLSKQEEIELELVDNKNLVSFINDELKYLDQIDFYQQDIKSKEAVVESLTGFKWTEENQENLSKYSNLLNESKKNLDTLESTCNEFNSFISTQKYELNSLNKSKLKLEKNLENVPTKCPTCGKPYDNIEEAREHIRNEIKTVQNQIDYINNGLAEISCPVSLDEINKIKLDINHYNEEITKLKQLLTQSERYNRALEALNKAKFDFNTFIEQKPTFNKSNSDRPALIDQLNKLNDQISANRGKLSEINTLNKIKNQFDRESEKLSKSKQELEDKNNLLVKYNEYCEMFTPNGSVTASVFSAVASEMSDDNLIVRTVKELASGETRIDFDVDKKVGNLILPYSDLSGGQQTLVDILFMYKLFKMSGQLGLLILDETLKEIDSVVIDDIVTVLKSMPVNTILISTHVESFPYFDNRINIQLNGNTSEFTVEG